MNALSSVSGCGLAFLFLAIEAMSDGGVRVGLPRALSTDLATQAFIGAARLVQETGKHPGQVGRCTYTPNIKGAALWGNPRLQKTKRILNSYSLSWSLKFKMLREKRQICAKTSSKFFCPNFVVRKSRPNIFTVKVIKRRSPCYFSACRRYITSRERTVGKRTQGLRGSWSERAL